jgi:hypothetical protein
MTVIYIEEKVMHRLERKTWLHVCMVINVFVVAGKKLFGTTWLL